MSVVTDILLCTQIQDGGHQDDDHPNAGALNRWLVQRYGEACALKRLDIHARGNKAMQADVYGVAVNCCNTDELVGAFRAIPWDDPESAQLLVKEEDWPAFRVFSAVEES